MRTKRSPALMLSVALSSVAADAQVPPPIVGTSHEVIPHIRTMPSAGPGPGQVLVTWTAQNVRCGGVAIAFSQAPAPMPALRWSGASNILKSVDYSFTIDATGRPLDVARGSKDYLPAGADLAPALVAAKFPAGKARQGCSLTFVPAASAVSEAPVTAVMTYIMFPEQRPTLAMFARTRPAGSTCFDPPPEIRNRAFPAFDAIPKQTGQAGWSMIGFDIDARGKPVHLKHEAGNGNAVLDKASLVAVADSKFAPGARTGCQYPYWIAAATLASPSMPEEAPFRPASATCPLKADWATKPPLNYPRNFGRRWIEGWAIVGYDVASWGEIGNVRVLASQPSAEFGEQASQMLRSAKWTASATGYVGCVDRVSFRMPRPGVKPTTPYAAEDAPPPF
ncbi:energy transducer TonB [Sphingomonas sp. M1A8_2b]